jgi:two-component system LytT family sensor kinase
MRSVYGEEYALMVETAPGAGMKVILRVPKFSPNVRPAMPGYTDQDDPDDTEPGRHSAFDNPLADSGVSQINIVT